MSKHKIISFIKSGIRLVGFGLGAYVTFKWRHASTDDLVMFHAFIFLFLAEVLGVIEEFYEVTPSPMAPDYTDWSGTHHWSSLDSGVWKNGPDGVSFGPKE